MGDIRSPDQLDATADAAPDPTDHVAPHAAGVAPSRRGWISGLLRGAGYAAREVLSVAVGRPRADDASQAGEVAKNPPDAEAVVEPSRNRQRVGMLHRVTEQLRGAADSYVAAKLDEIEARVDQKLDEIEARIDQKSVDLHRQLAEWRDQELRHRLRILKLTLIFTVLVAVLSLGYNWVSKHWF